MTLGLPVSLQRNRYGHFIILCAHRDGNPFGLGKGKQCRRPATNSEYGMDRCDNHVDDLNPNNWPANQKESSRES